MRMLLFSDSHGSSAALGELTLRIAEFQPELILMLGDALYHGPRNALPSEYDAKKAASMLNVYKKRLIAVRGNCDCEVDQMMLEYPMMSDFSTVFADGTHFFLTHGHIWNAGNLPPVQPKTVLAHGHTHVPELRLLPEGIVLVNPGSIAIPKQNNPASYATWENGTLAIRELITGNVLRGMMLNV